MQHEIYDETYRGRDISIYRTEDDYTVDVKHPCGELIRGWEGLPSLALALSHAKTYIYALSMSSDHNKIHCDNEYCQGESHV